MAPLPFSPSRIRGTCSSQAGSWSCVPGGPCCKPPIRRHNHPSALRNSTATQAHASSTTTVLQLVLAADSKVRSKTLEVERVSKDKPTSKPQKGSSGGPEGPGGNGGGPRPGRPSELQLLAGQAAYTGFVGTTALVLARLLGIDLFSMFQWTNLQHLELGLLLVAPLLVANVVLLAPDWSDWKLPGLTPEEEDGERQAARAAAARRSNSNSNGSDAAQAGSTSSYDEPDGLMGMLSSTDSSSSDASGSGTGHSSSSGGAGGGSRRSMSPPPVPARSWGQVVAHTAAEPPSLQQQLRRGLRLLRDAANLAQTNYVANNPTANVSPAAEVAVGVLDSLSSEMLFRGVLITLLTGWAREFFYQAGLPDLVEVPGPLGTLITGITASMGPAVDAFGEVVSPLVPVEDLARWVAGGGLLLLLGLLSARRVGKAARHMKVMQDIRSRIDVVRAAQLKERQASQQRGDVTSSSDSMDEAPSSSSSNSSTDSRLPQQDAQQGSATPKSSTAPQPDSKKSQQIRPPLAGMAGSALPEREEATTGKEAKSVQEGRGRRSAGKRTPGWAPGFMVTMAGNQIVSSNRMGGPGDNTPFDAVVWSTALQASRDLLQTGTLTMLFVATGGNLGACVAASLVNTLVFSALQRLGIERTKKRSQAMAAELEAFNQKLLAIVKKKQEQQQAKIQALGPARPQSQQPQQEGQESPAPQKPQGEEAASSMQHNSQPQGEGGAAAAQGPAPAASQTSQGGDAAGRNGAAAGVVGAAEALPKTGLARTLGMLDLLVPEPAKAPAASSRGSTGSDKGASSSPKQDRA